MNKLEKIKFVNNDAENAERPVFIIVMDGVGLAPDTASNAVKNAKTPTLDMLVEKYPMLKLKAHGTAVGLPSDDDMGNSEVGHNAIGAGQVFAQGAKLVSNSIESGKMFDSKAWKEIVSVKDTGKTLHFIGLFSDGNVHSHIDHLKAMLVQAKKEGVHTVRIHILLDGRDVGETSALDYVIPFEAFLAELNDASFDAKIASGGGRMNITMDRYGANWPMVEKGWHTHSAKADSLLRLKKPLPNTARKPAASTKTCRRLSLQRTASRSAPSTTATALCSITFAATAPSRFPKPLKKPILTNSTVSASRRSPMQVCSNTTAICTSRPVTL